MPWNRQSKSALERPKRPEATKSVVLRAAINGTLLVLLIIAHRNRELLPHYLEFDYYSLISYLLGTLLSLGCAAQTLQAILPAHSPQWEKGLTARQKILFGLPATQDQKPSAAPQAAAHKSPLPSLGPPLQRARRPLTPQTEGISARSGRPPLTPNSSESWKRTSSPYNDSVAVTTPEQLRQYLNAFESSSREASPAAAPGVTGDQQGATISQPLFGGTDGAVQTYRPSLQARGQTGSPLRADSVLSPSNQETFEAVLGRLQTDPGTLEAWIDRFREWLSTEVIKPLVRHTRQAHLDVAQSACQLGWNRVELADLSQPTASSSNRGLEADEEAQINALRAQLTSQLQQPMQEQQRKAVLACLQAVKQYQNLTLLLRGENPNNLLPPVPRGYIASRLHALAEGSCLADFNWNSGGSWQGKPWTTELLTDSALVFYLFAAFLKAPEWQFPMEEQSSPVTTAPLYIGHLPSRPAQHCSALLPVRPASLPTRAAAVLALGLASKEPSFTLVMHGQPALTFSNYTAVFIQLLLLIRYNDLENFGMLGNNNLDFLKLDGVLHAKDAFYPLLKAKWFALW